MSSNATRVIGAAIAACIGALFFAGCGSSPNAATTTTQQSKSSSASTPSLPKTVPNDPSQRHNVSMQKCQAIPGGWEAGGTAVNPGHSSTTYLVTVYFTDSHATVVGYAQTTVKVAPGQNVQWTASSHFAAPTKTLCVLSGVS